MVSELDSLAAVASAGQLADVVKVGKVDAEHAQKVLEASASQCNSVLPHISGSVKARDQESYIQGLRAQFHHLKELVDNSKVSAVTQSEVKKTTIFFKLNFKRQQLNKAFCKLRNRSL